MKPNESIKVIKFTDDEWYSNETLLCKGKPTRVVTASFILLTNGLWRVCVWGNDDFGLERDYPKRMEAVLAFRRIIKMDRVNKQPLKDMGFYNA